MENPSTLWMGSEKPPNFFDRRQATPNIWAAMKAIYQSIVVLV
jgi:hypothetical protein